MGQLRAELFGPSFTVEDTTTYTIGTTSPFADHEIVGPILIITDTVFNTACVMATGGGNKPSTSATYSAGTTVYKYFTTLKLTSGAVEVVGHKSGAEIGLPQ